MDYEYNDRKQASVYSRRLKAGKRRTYFFDVRETRGNDFFLTITESRKRFNDDGYDRHKIFLYKEDFNKFIKALGEAVDFVKTDLMPDYDFDIFSHEGDEQHPEGQGSYNADATYPGQAVVLDSQAPTIEEAIVENSATDTHSVMDTDKLCESGSEVSLEADLSATENPVEAEQSQVAAASSINEEAERMEAPVAASEVEEESVDDQDVLNATTASKKLASEEVEKW
ncbi:MAG TPA: DUF3276 family protein [Arachidicoccus sp.]|nr:DUF3276 family protein [Arachidicoccus sp.]